MQHLKIKAIIMKSLIINFSEKSSLSGLLKGELSFLPFVDFIENKLVNETTVKKEMLQFVKDGLKKLPDNSNSCL